MSMLAGPRRKQKVINLRAKNNAWSNDSNKFGQRMLEKMGWSSGKGLGANENGIVEHVIAKYKNDERGLGFEDKNDQWTKHEDDFNALLANLSNASNDEVPLHSGKSLEDKSKKSKARIHYHKFTRGKDLSKYSEKDLANIFGKKTFKNKDVSPTEIEAKEDIKMTEQIFTEKGSMEDYFKTKLAAFKTKTNISSLSENVRSYDEDTDFAFKGFVGTGSDEKEDSDTHQGFGFQPFSFYNTNDESKEDDMEIKKKIKKKKKSKCSEMEINENNESLGNISDSIPNSNEPELPKEKVKKSKNNKASHNTQLEVENEEPPKKKKSKNKVVLENTESVQELPEDVLLPSTSPEIENEVPQKKKKSKNKIVQEDIKPVEDCTEELPVPKKKKKKDKKNK